jgi:ribonuclease HII
MENFEQKAWSQETFVCGIDEAGRGSLSGPLVAAAAILPQHTSQTLLKDSKVMSKREREKAFEWITKNCFFSYVIIDPKTIDKKNIYQATKLAMKKSFLQILHVIPFNKNNIKYLITDAVKISVPESHIELRNPNHAESISPTVAAASIIAKVTRDRIMDNFSSILPAFDLKTHKGYGTKKHIGEIKKNGISIIHRNSFVSNFIPSGDSVEQRQQQTIC